MRLVLEETINAPKRVVFDVFTDLAKASERIESITKLEIVGGGPVGKGTRFRETRIMFGKKEETQEMTIAAFDAPNSYTVEGYACGARFYTVYDFDGGQRETKVTMTVTSRNETLFAKVIGPIMGKLMTGAMKKAMCKDHAELKAVCEQLAAGSPEGQ